MSETPHLDEIAGKIAEKMAAMLFVVGGPAMIEHDFVDLGASGTWRLTQKGQQFFHAVLRRLPSVEGING